MFNVTQILEATGARLLRGSKISKAKAVSTDTRTIKRGDLFLALKGTNYDGNTFAEEAMRKGASGVVVSVRKVSPNLLRVASDLKCFVIAADETLKALGEIALSYRNRFDIPVVAVTGSNGKTTTKEMIAGVLEKKWSPLKNSGTQNNLVGVPLTVFKLTDRHRSLVIELGMNRAGEIRRLAGIVQPNVGVITNIGPVHLQYFKDLDAVYRAKKELLDFLSRRDTAVLNNDDTFLRRFRKKGLKIFTFGIKNKSDIRAERIKKGKSGWSFTAEKRHFFIPLAARHDIYNALAALSVGILFNIDFKDISEGLSSYRPLEKRMARSVLKGIELIDDTYNSNPLSLENAIRTLAGYRARGKKILVAGDMLELGGKAPYYHRKIGRLVACSDIDNFISVGTLMHEGFLAAKRGGMKNNWYCSSKEEAASILRRIAVPHDVILVKGSRATEMEDVIKCFTTSFTR